MWETEQFWGTIDFHRIFFPTLVVNGAPKQPGYKFYSEYVQQNKDIHTGLELLEGITRLVNINFVIFLSSDISISSSTSRLSHRKKVRWQIFFVNEINTVLDLYIIFPSNEKKNEITVFLSNYF